MPATTLLDIPQQELAQRLAARRRARSGYLLAVPIVLLWAAGRHPTAMATVLCCARARVARTVRLYRAGHLGFTHHADGQLATPGRTTVVLPVGQRSVRALLKASLRAYGWCRTRWSGAPLAAPLTATPGRAVSAWPVRRWLHALGGAGNAPSLWPKMTSPSGASASPASAGRASPWAPPRCWGVLACPPDAGGPHLSGPACHPAL
jgi:hypothetical protein